MQHTLRPHAFVAVSLFALGVSGCTARVYGAGYAYIPEPEPVVYYEHGPILEEIGPDVWVVCGHDQAVYHHGGYYWYYEEGLWYRSVSWGGPRIHVYVHGVPGVIVHLDHHHYVRYRGNAQAHRRRGPSQGGGGGHGYAQGSGQHHKAGPPQANRPPHQRPAPAGAGDFPREAPRSEPRRAPQAYDAPPERPSGVGRPVERAAEPGRPAPAHAGPPSARVQPQGRPEPPPNKRKPARKEPARRGSKGR